MVSQIKVFLSPEPNWCYSSTSESCIETSSLFSVNVMSHLCSLGVNTFREEERGGNGELVEERKKMTEGWPENKKKRAIPYSLINLNVNCRLMSWRSGMLLGKMKPEENMVPDRCTTEPLNGAVVLSAPSILHTTDLDHHTCCHTVRASSSMWNSGIEVGAAATAATANSLLFLLLLAFFLSLTHTHSNGSPTSFSFYSFTCFFFPLLRILFGFFSALPRLRLHRPTSGQHATVLAPTITSADTLILKVSCLSLTNNDQQPVYLCQGTNTHRHTHSSTLSPFDDVSGGLWGLGAAYG